MIRCLSHAIRSRWGRAVGSLLLAATLLLICVNVLVLSPAGADETGPPPEVTGPGSHTISADPVPPEQARRILFGQQDPKHTEVARLGLASLPTSETEATPEIQSLARGLENDPKRIFDYVHNHIDYVPTFGSVNGAEATLLAGRGNDWDQASLFIALMRAAGYTADYVVGDVVYEVERLANWVGVEDDINIVGNVFAAGGVPVEGSSSPPGLKITRVWAEVEIDGTTYTFDPAMKAYEEVAGIDLGTAIGYNRATFMSRAQAGATVTSDYAQDMNEANVRADLAAYSMNLADHIKNNLPEASLAEVIGGRSIMPTEMTDYPTSLPYALSVGDQTNYAEVPADYRHSLRVQYEGIDQTFDTFQIAGKRMTLFYRPADGVPELRVDGELIEVGNPSAGGDLTLTVDHPYAANGGTYGDQEGAFGLLSGNEYAIIHDFEGVEQALITKRSQLLDQYQAQGYAQTSEAARGEAMHIMGLTWFHEEWLYMQLLGRLAGVVSMQHHRVGVMGQEEGYFINIPLIHLSLKSATGDATAVQAVARARAMMSSAFEHGALEQQQGNGNPAVSTIRLLQLSNNNGMKTYLAHAGNWSAVRPELTNYYVQDLNWIESYINAGHEFVLPEDAAITLNEWRGVGYIQHYLSGDNVGMDMWIFGSYYGGRGSVQEQLDAWLIVDGDDPPDKDRSVVTPKSKDPVDMTSGVFLYGNSDLSIGPSGLLGLRFSRAYNSGDNLSLGPLGYGWHHNYERFLIFHSSWGPGLGQRHPTDAAAMITYAYVALDLMENELNIQGWTATTLATKWAMDQLLDNAVTVNLGATTLEYIELADGSYNPPPNIRQELVQVGGSYFLQGQPDACLTFDGGGRIRAWQDRNDNTLTFSYDGDGQLQTVANTLGLSLTLTYNGTHLASVTDFAGRSVSYEYTGDELTTYRDAENQAWHYGYDAAHRLTSVTHPLGNVVVTNAYDDLGRVITQTDALTNTTTFYFSDYQSTLEDPEANQTGFDLNGQGRMTGQTDALGKKFDFNYDGQGQLVGLTDRMEDTTETTYHDASGKIASYTDAGGHTATYTYTAQLQTFTNPVTPTEEVSFTFYNLTRITYADGSFEDLGYDDHGNVISRTDRLGEDWATTYNTRGQPLTVTNPEGGVITNTYNTDGNLETSTDSDVGVTTYGYDDYKRLSTITRPDSNTVGYTYDLNDRLLTVTDELNRTSVSDYDDNGNLIATTNPLSKTVGYAYDPMDRMETRTDPVGQVGNLSYDALGRLASVTDRNGYTTAYTYDERGWRIGVTDHLSHTWTTAYDDEGVPSSSTTPLGFTTFYQTDKLGRTTVVTDPLGAETHFTYDPLGRVISTTDRIGRTTDYAYDDAGRLISVTLPLTRTAVYTRNTLGLLTHITDLRGKVWEFGYSPMGRRTTHTDPLSNQWAYDYDARGRLEQVTYPDTTSASHTYDAAGQITQTIHSDGPTLNYTYDDAGRLLTANHVSLTYDSRGDVINSQDEDGAAFGATYDDGRRLKTVTYDGQATVTYTYDERDLLTRVEDDLAGAWLEFTYDDDRRLTDVQRSNGVDTTFTYDDVGRVTRIQDSALADQQYTLNDEGEPTQVARTLPLDPPPVGQVGNLSYDDASQISGAGYAYDVRGRQTAAPGESYTYDGASRLTSIAADGQTVDLTYNGLGDLRTRAVGGTTTTTYHNYALGLAPIVAESEDLTGFQNLSGLATDYKRFYVYTPGGSLLYSIEPAGWAVRFYHFDRVGSALFLTDGGGSVTDAYAYDPYGVPLGHDGTSDQPFTYVGRYGVRWEPVGELYDMRARTYDPAAARFLTRDPAWPVLTDPASLNPYQYAHQNPLRYIDPQGEQEAGGPPGLNFLGMPEGQSSRGATERYLKELEEVMWAKSHQFEPNNGGTGSFFEWMGQLTFYATKQFLKELPQREIKRIDPHSHLWERMILRHLQYRFPEANLLMPEEYAEKLIQEQRRKERERKKLLRDPPSVRRFWQGFRDMETYGGSGAGAIWAGRIQLAHDDPRRGCW